MRLCFLLERRYAPYTKWLGRAFARLETAAEVGAHLTEVLAATEPSRREEALGAAHEAVARRHNALGITHPVDPARRPFHARPYLVLDADRFADACVEQIGDEWLTSLPLVGSVDQFADSTDVLAHAQRSRRLRGRYDEP